MDREYTSGLFLRFGHKPKLHGFSIEIGSQLWTPANIGSTDPQPEQRPYAGLLYLQARTHYQTAELALKTSLLLGLVGPKSQGEDIQTFAHRVIKSPIPNGWKYQIEEQEIYQFGLEVHHLLHRPEKNFYDLGLFTRGQIGNFQNEIALGAGFRMGLALDKNFGSTSPALNNSIDTDLLEGSRNGFFLYTMAETRYRYTDLLIEGDKPRFFDQLKIKHEQLAVAIGLIFYKEHWGAGASFNWHSKTYQAAQAKNHNFANITVFYRF